MENKLVHLAEFRRVLKGYKISEANQAILKQTRLVLLVGPTSSGRNTLLAELAKRDEYYHIVSDTTRKLRMKGDVPIEQNGREYWFRDEEDVLAGLHKGEYMEAAIIHNQQVSGCNIREIEKAQQTNKVAIKDIEPSGAASIYSVKPDVIIIFVLPPNLDEWRRRLHSRSELPAKELKRRLVSARQELKVALSHDHYQFVINATVPDAVRQVHNIVKNNSQKPKLQRQGRELAQELLQAIAKS